MCYLFSGEISVIKRCPLNFTAQSIFLASNRLIWYLDKKYFSAYFLTEMHIGGLIGAPDER
jgi:hypothetical protein